MSPYPPPDSVIEVERGPEPGGLGGAYRAFGMTLRGLATVFARVPEGPVTIQYPDQKPYLPPRWRGRIILSRDPDGEERCVACYLCAVACPVDCIALQATEDKTGRRYPEFFRINFSRCIFCGFCEESCPVDSIVETHILEYHGEKRGDLYFTKDMLLAVGDRYEAEIAANKAADAPYR